MSKLAADRVARHLVAAGRLVDEDPEAALVQARAARALGARVAVVRQAVGETAYAAGEWAEAIAELRTARRMTGDDSALPLLADAERALGRPDRALRLAQSPEAQALPPAERAELRIVEAGARRDLGQLDAALVTLQDSGLDRRTVEPWSARLWYAFADLLLALGRAEEAREWFAAAAAADQDGTTDADERILEIDGVEVLLDDLDDPDDASPLEDMSPEDGSDSDDGDPPSSELAGETPGGRSAEDGGPLGGGLADDGGIDDGGIAPGDGLPGEGSADDDSPTGEGGASVEDAGPVAGGFAEGGDPSDGGPPSGGSTDGDGFAAESGSQDAAPDDRGGPAEDGSPADVLAEGGVPEGGAADGGGAADTAAYGVRFSSEVPGEEAVAERPPAVGPAFSDGSEAPAFSDGGDQPRDQSGSSA